MKRTLFFICILFFFGFVDTVVADIDISISASSVEIVDAHTFKVRKFIAPGFSGNYWATFRWDPVNLVFVPVALGEELKPACTTWSWTVVSFNDSFRFTMTSDPGIRAFRVSYQTLSGTPFLCLGEDFMQGDNQFTLITWEPSGGMAATNALIIYDTAFDGCGDIFAGQTISATITNIPAWFDFTKTFSVSFGAEPMYCEPDGRVHK